MKILLVLALVAGTARAEPRPTHRTARWLAAIAGETVHELIGNTFEGDLAPATCRWCDPPRLDRIARKHLAWNDRERAGSLSDVTAYVATPTGAGALLLVAAGEGSCRWRRFADDALPIVEAYVYTDLFTELVKLAVGRQRPDSRFEGAAPTSESNLSFYSGHTSDAFSLAVAAGTVAHQRGYKLEPAIWAIGLTAASATAYLRVAADRHYLTDVLAGAAAGIAGGYLIPRFTARWRTAILPTRSGIAIGGSF